MPTEILRQIIEMTLAQFGRAARYDDYQAIAFKIFPAEMEALASSFARQGFVRWLKEGLNLTANEGETDPTAPQIQLNLLPGLKAPAFLNIGSDTEPKLIRVQDSIVADWDLCIAKRHRVAARISRRAEDMAQKAEWFRSNAESETETLGQLMSRLPTNVAAA